MAGLASLGSPGLFKARKKHSEKLTDFNLYIMAISHMMTLTDNVNAMDAKKKALLQTLQWCCYYWYCV